MDSHARAAYSHPCMQMDHTQSDLPAAANESSHAYAGWRVTAAAFVGVMFSFAAMVPFTFSLFLTPLQSAFGWKIQAISNGFAIAALTVAACSPFIGSFLDRLPPRRIILPSIVIFAAAMASLSLLRGHIAQFYGTYVVLGIVGNGTAQLSYSRALLTWFERRRGLAIAIMLTGSGTGSIVLPIIAQHIITAYGWRTAYLSLGGLALLGFPLTALLVRNRPAASAPAAIAHPSVKPASITSVLRARVFWVIAIAILLAAFSMNATIAHLAKLLTGRGVTPASAALALSMLGISGMFGRIITGHLLDRLFAPMVALVVLIISALGVVVVAYATTAPIGIAGAFLMGFGSGSEADTVPYLIAKYFGRARFSTLYGLSWTAYAIGGALGPVVLGHAFDMAGVYRPATMLLIAAPCFVAGLLQIFLPKYPVVQENISAMTFEPASQTAL
jgi:MFS family permease